ncbi:MAG: endonuclease III domain-containing protein [Planctomycetota bacterium JB042]
MTGGPTTRSRRARRARVDRIVTRLAAAVDWHAPVMNLVKDQAGDPWTLLAGTILSLRTKDEVTHGATKRLVAIAPSPAALLDVPERTIADTIYPVGFYRTKAKSLRATARLLVDEHGGEVPADRDALLSLPGVGRKTANLVLALGFEIPAICVDTHVHRISNRLAFCETDTPDETERELEEVLPRRHWLTINELLVGFGQAICQPVSPWCSRCPIRRSCPRVGVERSR